MAEKEKKKAASIAKGELIKALKEKGLQFEDSKPPKKSAEAKDITPESRAKMDAEKKREASLFGQKKKKGELPKAVKDADKYYE